MAFCLTLFLLSTGIVFSQEEKTVDSSTELSISKLEEKTTYSSTELSISKLKENAENLQEEGNYLENFLISLKTRKLYEFMSSRVSRLNIAAENFNSRFPNKTNNLDAKNEYKKVIEVFDLANSYFYQNKFVAYEYVTIYLKLKMKRLYNQIRLEYKQDAEKLLENSRMILLKKTLDKSRELNLPYIDVQYLKLIVQAKSVLNSAYRHLRKAQASDNAEDYYNSLISYKFTAYYAVFLQRALQETAEGQQKILIDYDYIIRDTKGLLIDKTPNL